MTDLLVADTGAARADIEVWHNRVIAVSSTTSPRPVKEKETWGAGKGAIGGGLLGADQLGRRHLAQSLDALGPDAPAG